jgi:hypothetical protein
VITVQDDKKRKHQSCEAHIDVFQTPEMGCLNCNITGYGADEAEARKNLIEIARNLVKSLELDIGE